MKAKTMTYIYQELTPSNAAHMLREGAGKDCFTWEGALALMEYIQEICEETGKPYEFDGVALRCEWNEYEDEAELLAAYSNTCETMEDIENNTRVIRVPGGRLVTQAF